MYWYLTPVGSVNALSSDERTIPVNRPVLSNVGLTESITVVTSTSMLIFNEISEPEATLFTSSASAAVEGVTVAFQLPGATESAVGIAPAPVTTWSFAVLAPSCSLWNVIVTPVGTTFVNVIVPSVTTAGAVAESAHEAVVSVYEAVLTRSATSIASLTWNRHAPVTRFATTALSVSLAATISEYSAF